MGDSLTLGTNVFDGNSLRNLNTLMDGGDKWISSLIGAQKSCFYEYPSIEEFNNGNLNIVYLGPV